MHGRAGTRLELSSWASFIARRTMRSLRVPMGNQQATPLRLAASISLLISSNPFLSAHSLSSCATQATQMFSSNGFSEPCNASILFLQAQKTQKGRDAWVVVAGTRDHRETTNAEKDGGRTGANEVRPEDASQSASMKSRVAPKVVCRSRGDDGGDRSAAASPATTTPGSPPGQAQH